MSTRSLRPSLSWLSRRKRTGILAFLAAVLAVAGLAPSTLGANAAPGGNHEAPSALRADGRDRPADLEDLGAVTLSWQLPAIRAQHAYEIVVSSTKNLADAHQGDVWSTGKVVSADQTGIRYAGPALAGSERYFWSVRVWNDGDEVMPWSDVSWFGTGPGSSWSGATPVWTPSRTSDWTDYTASFDLTVTSVATGVFFRSPDSGDAYMWQFRADRNQLVPHRLVGGSYTALDPVALPAGMITLGRPVHVEIAVDGSTITTTVNGTQVDQRTLALFSSGIIGFRNGSTESGRFDNVRVIQHGTGRELFATDFSTAGNPFACGSVVNGALEVGKGQACLLKGFGNEWALLRKDVTLPDKPIAWASLFATATSWSASRQYVYKFAVNGTFVGLGPTASMGSETRYDGFDVTSLLRQGGANTLSAQAYSRASDPRLIASLVIQYADGTRDVLGTGSDWQAMSGSLVYPDAGSYGTSTYTAPKENLDEREYPSGWDQPGFDASAWHPAVERSPIPNLQAAPMSKVTQQEHAPASITDLGGGHYIVDFGRTWLGGVSWDISSATAGQSVQLRFGEVVENGSVRYKTRSGATYLDTPTLKDGAQHLDTWGLRTFRYVEVVDSPVPLTPQSFRALALVYPFDPAASQFQASDPSLVQVYDLSKNTIEAVNQNFYTDSYERERTNYEADSYLQQMSSLYLMDDLSLGRYSMDYFKTNRTWPTEWPVFVVLAVHDAWRQTGDTQQVAAYYDNLVTKLPTEKWWNPTTHLVDKTCGADGVNGCKGSTDEDIVDWPQSQRDGYVFREHNTVVNAISYRALVDMSQLATAIGRDADAQRWADQAASLRDAINTYLYDPVKGAYDDGADGSLQRTGHFAVQASAFALAFGVAQPDQAERAASYVASRGLACSVYCAGFLIKGLYDGGQGQAALDLLTSTGTHSWMHMIALGAGATMEAWDAAEKSNLSYSHPWAASPAFVVPAGLFGIQPDQPGYAAFTIKPQPGSLQWASLRVPTVRGSVGAAFDQGDGGTATLVASVPGNTRATVAVPTTATSRTRVYVDGRPSWATPQGGYVTFTDVLAGCHVFSATAQPPAAVLDRLTTVCTEAPRLPGNGT
ncbi:hypothetical protein GCM10027053_00100 [Intrasporangium mesophilum]